MRRNSLRSTRRSLCPFIRQILKQIVVIREAYNFCQLNTKFYPSSCCQGKLHMQRKLLWIISVDFDARGHYRLCIPHSSNIEKKLETMKQCISYLLISKKPTIQSQGRSCIIFSLRWYSMKLVRMINMCVNETYSRVRVGRHLSDIQ